MFLLLFKNQQLAGEREAEIHAFIYTQGVVALPSPATPGGQHSAHLEGHASSSLSAGLSHPLSQSFPKGAPRTLSLSTQALHGLGARNVWHRAGTGSPEQRRAGDPLRIIIKCNVGVTVVKSHSHVLFSSRAGTFCRWNITTWDPISSAHWINSPETALHLGAPTGAFMQRCPIDVHACMAAELLDAMFSRWWPSTWGKTRCFFPSGKCKLFLPTYLQHNLWRNPPMQTLVCCWTGNSQGWSWSTAAPQAALNAAVRL